MKVTGPGPIRSDAVRRARKTETKRTEGFSKHLRSEEEGPLAPVASAGPLAPVDALIALQEVHDDTTGRGRAVVRGFSMLDLLDEIRHGLLTGSIPRDRLQALLEAVRNRGENFDDPRLAQLVDEIELRASVELAKLGQLA